MMTPLLSAFTGCSSRGHGFPGPTWWLTASVNPLPVDLIPPPAPGMYLMYYIQLGKTPIHPTLRKKFYSEIL